MKVIGFRALCILFKSKPLAEKQPATDQKLVPTEFPNHWLVTKY